MREMRRIVQMARLVQVRTVPDPVPHRGHSDLLPGMREDVLHPMCLREMPGVRWWGLQARVAELIRGALMTTSWTTCSNPQFGFEFQYPQGWENVPGIPSIIYHPTDAKSFITSDGGKSKEVFSPALTLMMMPRGNTAGQTPDEVFQGFKRLLPSYFADYECQSEQSFQLPSGQEAMEITFDFLKTNRPFRAVLAYVVRPSCILIFDGSGLRDDFANFEPMLRQSIQSLRVR